MGRPPKSKTLKQVQGTFSKSRQALGLNLSPLEKMPEIPKEFNENEKWFYQTACEALFNSGMLRSADLMTIESMAGWWSILKESQKDIRDNGMIQEAATGWKGITPSVAAFEKAWNKLKDFSDRYGFNLLSRDKISSPPPKDDKSEVLKQMMNGH